MAQNVQSLLPQLCSVMSKLKDEKKRLRIHYRAMRDKMTGDYKRSLDIEIASRLLCTEEYMDAKTLLIYVSSEHEVQTRGIIHAAFACGKAVAVPKCEGKGKMNFYLITSEDDLEQGFGGIMEPIKDRCRLLEDFSQSICIVPGLSFDPEGYRLGTGGGYYDRFLSDYDGISVGLCYGSFITWELPKEPHDLRVQLLITDRYVRHTADKS